MFDAYATNTLQYDAELCINCGMCIIVCPHAVFAPNGHVAQLVHPGACMECGACQLNCPVGAIVVESGVGCAAAMISAALTGRKEVTCGGPDGPSCCGTAEPAASCGGEASGGES
jgi:NAD-dependent dihydropyrimidine dehydrogenase PreA subunit